MQELAGLTLSPSSSAASAISTFQKLEHSPRRCLLPLLALSPQQQPAWRVSAAQPPQLLLLIPAFSRILLPGYDRSGHTGSRSRGGAASRREQRPVLQ